METLLALKQCPLFAGLNTQQLERLQEIAQKKKYPKGKLLFGEGQSATGFYLLLSGQIKLYKLSAEGKEQILHIVNPTEPFAEVALFAEACYPAYAESLTASEGFYFPKTAFLALLQEDPQLSLNMLATMAQFLRRFNRLVERLSLQGVSARLALYLLQESSELNTPQQQISLKLTKTQLAAQLGTISETLSRTLKKFKEDGIITVAGKCITILDKQALSNISGSDPLMNIDPNNSGINIY